MIGNFNVRLIEYKFEMRKCEVRNINLLLDGIGCVKFMVWFVFKVGVKEVNFFKKGDKYC